MGNKIIIGVALVIMAFGAGYWFTLPKNYNDCILKYAHTAQTNIAAYYVEQSCREKFTEKKEISIDIPGFKPLK